MTLPNAPSKALRFSMGIICPVAAGITDINTPEQRPYRHAKTTMRPGWRAGSHMAKHRMPDIKIMGCRRLKWPILSATCPPLWSIVSNAMGMRNVPRTLYDQKGSWR